MIRRLIAIAVVLAAAAPATAAELRAFSSIVPIRTFVERVGGERVDVSVMVGPGASPATYEPTPRQMAAVADSRLFFRVGVPFERAWMERIAVTNPQLDIVDLREGLPLRPLATHDHDHDPDPEGGGHGEHDGEGGGEALDPHVWTDPANVIVMARHIRDRLTELDPQGRDYYSKRFEAFHAELEALDAELRQLLADVERRRFLVYHPSWGYFAAAYGLEQVAVEVEGKEPGPRRLQALIEDARASGIGVIFVQSQFSRRSAGVVAEAVGAEVVAVDPLAADYVANMRRVGRAFAEAMR